MLKCIVLVALVAFLSDHADSSRILAVIPTPSYSHQMFYHQLWREYAIRGHEIVVITTDPTNETLPNFKEISISESYGPMKKMMKLMIDTGMVKMMLQNSMTEFMNSFYEFQLNLPQVQQLVNNRSEQFDLLIIEHFPSPLMALKHRFNCPMIGVLSLEGMHPSHEIMGNADHSVLYPTPIVTLGESPAFYQRVVAVVVTNMLKFVQNKYFHVFDMIARNTFGENVPSIYEILESTDMLFVNANPVINAVRPHSPSTISLAGGIHMKPEKPLPKNIKDFLDNSKQGAIYFSLGSNVKSNELTPELRQIILDTLAQLPHNILWKFEEDNLPGKPNNVMITKWAPQQDILRHKNVKVFITQVGLQSLEEALYSHVPLVLMPFFGDQEANAKRAEEKGIGVVVDRHNLKVDDFKGAILEVMKNPIYRNAVKRLAIQIQDTPMTPLNRAIWWTEYVLRHKGAQHLKGPRIPFYQYYYIDVLATLGAVFLTVCGLFYGIVKLSIKGFICLMQCKKTKKSTKIEKFKKS